MTSLFRIRLVFLAAVLVSLAPFLGNRIWLAKTTFDQKLYETAHTVVSSVERAQKDYEESRTDIEGLLTTLYMMPSLTAVAPSACNRMLHELVVKQARIEHVSLIYPSGAVFCSSDPVAIGLSEAEEPHFQAALASNDISWSDFIFSHITGRPTLYATRAVYREGAIDYVLQIGMNLASLRQSFLNQFDLPVAQTALIDTDGIFLFRDAFLDGTPLFHTETIDKIRTMKLGVIEPNSFGAGQTIIGVAEIPDTTAHLAMAVSVGELYAAVKRDILSSLVVVFAEAMIIAVLVMLALEWLILRVLRQMIDVAQRIAAGDLSRRVEIGAFLPELGSLAKSINRMVESLEHAALADGMTGLANRRALDLHIERSIRRQNRHGVVFTLVMMDIDNFKPFNDQYGHGVGDQVLRLVGQTMTAYARRPDEIAARYGGEEFTMVLTETDPAKVFDHLDKLRAGVEALAVPHQGSPFGVVTISFGFTVTQRGDVPGAALARADRALYRAKQSGRNNIQFEAAGTDPPPSAPGSSPPASADTGCPI
jgi:diguanylate cyclase (GGDEF)-like protein